MRTFYEFFAGGGMARAGLKDHFTCVFANDFDRKKSATYRQNWGDSELRTDDVRNISPEHLPEGPVDLVWASFPCQDLSLAGAGAGLKGDRSGTFWPFWKLMQKASDSGRKASIIALENVCGTLTSHGGKDFGAIVEAFDVAGYDVGAMVIDAELFVPQSRPRLFFVGIQRGLPVPDVLRGIGPHRLWHPTSLQRAYNGLSPRAKEAWIWWNMPEPSKRKRKLYDILERAPNDVPWHSKEETQKLLGMMAPLHRRKLEAALKAKAPTVGALYRRTRRNQHDEPVQRAEIRFDDVAGCLRTPAGGSSRQLLMLVENGQIRSRLISARETARLMGLPDTYELPERYNEAYHLTGDGIVVHAVQYLSQHILVPLVGNGVAMRDAA